MCGWVGVLGPAAQGEAILRALPVLARRGPDGHGVWRDPTLGLALLHTRLAIVDRAPRSDQPMRDPGVEHVLAFNGEIYNFRELRAQWPDYAYQTDSDSEVLLAQLAMRGLAAFEDLRGMFSFGFVDRRRQRVLLARDPVGQKPLYFGRIGANVWFGSSVQAIAAACGASLSLRPEALSEYWRDGYVSPLASIYRELKPVLPGEVLELDGEGEIQTRQRWLPRGDTHYAGESEDTVDERLEALLQRAVRRCLGDHPTPSCLLSGGIDSSLITGITAEQRPPQQVLALSMKSLIPGTQDEPYARQAGRQLGIAQLWLQPQFRDIAAQVRWGLGLQDEPLGMISFFQLAQLVRLASERSRILLSGDGGDEVFLGYGRPQDWLQQAGRVDPATNASLAPGLPEWLGGWGRDMAATALVGEGLSKVDRASAEQGVEIRAPLLDWDLICYARSMPFAAISRDGRSKSLLKAALARRGFDRRFLDRPKLGFAFNLRYLWGLSAYRGLRELLAEEAVCAIESSLPPALRRRPATWALRDVFRFFPQVWRALALSAFFQRGAA